MIPHINPHQRLAVAIDGAHLHNISRAIGLHVDFTRLREFLAASSSLVRISYYAISGDDSETNNIRPVLDFLEYNSFSVIQKEGSPHIDPVGKRRFRGDFKVEMTVDALELAPRIDHLLISTGDFGLFRTRPRYAASRRARDVSFDARRLLRRSPPAMRFIFRPENDQDNR